MVAATSTAPALDQAKRDAVVQDGLSAFIRMYERHEATPGIRSFSRRCDKWCPPMSFATWLTRSRTRSTGGFGQAGFEGVVDKVADIEKSVGIYDLNQFTPT